MSQGVLERKIFFCVNQRAGGGKASAWWQQTLPLLQGRGLNFYWQYSEGGAKTSQQVREAVLHNQATAVVAIGGDGHLHDILNGLVEEDALIADDVVLALYPAGSGCDFARMIYQNKGDTNADGLLDLLTHGQILHGDVGRAAFGDSSGQAGHAYFLNGSDIGLGAQTCMYVNAYGGLLKTLTRDGKLAFLLATLQAIFHFDYPPIKVEADGECFEGSYLMAAIGNGRYMGGNMLLFPEARLDDGKLDLLLIEGFSRLKALSLLSRVYTGDILRTEGITFRQVRQVHIESAHRQPIELDGELPGFAPLTVDVLPGLLPLLCFEHPAT